MIKVLNVKSLYSALYESVEFCKVNNKETIEVIVPDKLSLFMEKFLFEQLNITSSFNIKVSTLNRFAKKSCFVEQEKQISKSGSILLIHKILNENHEKFQVLKNRSYSFSYAEDIFKTIGQLKASKINYEEMVRFDSTDSRLSGKIQDLALIYEQYEIGKAGLLDSSDMFLMSTLSVAKGMESKKILFVGFDDFTAIEYSIIERLALVAQVNIINYSSKADNKFLYNNEIISQLKKIAIVNQIPFEIETTDIEVSSLKKFLEENLYSLNNSNFCLTDEIVKVFAGNNMMEEIEFVARDIRSKVLKGERFDKFGVAVFGLENNLSEIKEIFEKYEINYYLDAQISINKSILFKFIVSILKYNLNGYSLSNLIDIINSPFFRLNNSEKRTIIQKLQSVNYRGKINDNFHIDISEDIGDKFFEFISNITFDKNISVSQFIDKIKILDGSLLLDETLAEISKGNIKSEVLLRKSKQIIFELFNDIIKFNDGISIDALLDIFVNVSSVVKINNLPLSLDAVQIVDANNTMEIFDELYIVGANQGQAPNLKYDCGIILDSEIEKLNFCNKLSPTIAHINRLAKLRLFNLLTMFENELTVTYSNTASEVVIELLKRIVVETEKGNMNIVPIKMFDHDCYVAMSKWDNIEFLAKNQKNNDKINENILKNKDFKEISQKNLEIYNDFNFISATTLENYFTCPFFAFLKNILKINPRLSTDILSLDIGNILHEIVYHYYKLKKQIGDVYEFCKNEVFKFVDKVERLKLNIESPILTNLIDEAVRVINAVDYIDKNSLFIPKYFEFGFNGSSALNLKNVSIVGKVDRVDIFNDMFRIVDYKSGKADASLKELYYGNKLQLFLYSLAMEKVLNKRAVGSFYLPLHNAYTKELTNTYSLKGFYLAEDFVVRAFDKRLEPGDKSDIVNVKLNKNNTVSKTIGYKELNINDLNKLKNYAKSLSENAVDEIVSGYIEPTPSGVVKPCEFCPYVHICMKNSCDIKYRAVNKVNLDSFKEVDNEGV